MEDGDMKQYKSLFIAALGLLALGACSVKEDVSLDTGRAIRFTTNLGGYAVKATDTDFEPGDQVSLYADEPISKYNVKMDYRDGQLVPEQDIMWPEGIEPTQAVNFLAVYPYSDSWEYVSDANVFSIRPDQSTHEGYSASDAMLAFYMAYPDCETVPLNFIHRMSRFDLGISSYLKEDITEVYLSGVYGKARLSVNYSMRTYTVGEKGTVKMGCISRENNGKYNYSKWSVILPPQTMEFKILMTTASGKQYTYSLSSWNKGVEMESAFKYNGSLALDSGSEPGAFSIAVTEWTDNADVQFGSYIPDEHHSEGDWILQRYNPELDSYTDLFFQYENVEGKESFIMYLNNPENTLYRLAYTRNSINYYTFGLQGSASGALGDGGYRIEAGDSRFSFASAGDLILEILPYSDSLTVRPDNDVWSLIGEFDGSNWTVDFPMERKRAGVYSATVIYFGEQFKFRCNGSWEVNFGLPKNWDGNVALTMNPDNGKPVNPVERNGQNITLESIGIWAIELDVHNKTFRAYNAGAEDAIFDGYRSYLGNWFFYHDADHTYDISITDAGTYYKINFDGVPMRAKYDPVDNSFKVGLQKMDEVETKYGRAGIYFLAYTMNEETQEIYGQAFGDDESVTLFTGKIDSGSKDITIRPAVFNGYPFSYYYMVFMILEGSYEGQYGYYFRDEFTFPQTWQNVND